MSQPPSFFEPHEQELLDEARRHVDAATATIAYCVYENPFARGGGIYAVAAKYSEAVQAAGRDIVVLSPFHSQLNSTPREPLPHLGSCNVPFDGDWVNIQLYEHRQGGTRWILFAADGFFDATGGTGGADPYVHDDEEKLLTDSLFAGAAIPYVLAQLGLNDNLIIHVQDWELAATALTAKSAMLEKRLNRAVVVLTSHNPYDHALPAEALAKLTSRRPDGDAAAGTVYQCFMPLFDAPVTTVSRVFAEDLTSDPLQTTYFADHLQPIFEGRSVIGVDNGLFLPAKPSFTTQAVAEAKAGSPETILTEKKQLRKTMLTALDEYQDSRIQGRLMGHDGGSLPDLPDDIPVFLMFGRLDPGQKGFDVLARAVEAMPRRCCRFVFTPIVPKTTAFSEDLRQLTERRDGEVAVYPFRMEKGYLETMAGATFAVLPSLYEPFGAATEPYLMGTPVIGRATGGLCQQIADINVDMTRATGLTFRETIPDESTVADDWRKIQTAKSPIDRMRVPLYSAMVSSLAATLVRAAELAKFDHVAYGRILANVFVKAESFSWAKTMAEYQEVYELATR